ncbi:MAG: 1-deoxy-D-xylulose-5-phosphate reductoisomerase [Lachnospiraceae bacterium]|nr:1-deoxy-D-xylulose-5-phosphate reductoisomerase [Lachnospiraceae bacterium]
MRDIAILGSTGSIGTQTLEIIEKRGGFRVRALTASNSVDLMEQQVRKFKPEICCMYNEDAAKELKLRLSDVDVKVTSGMTGLCEAAAIGGSETLTVTAIVGMIGIEPTLAAMDAGCDIALANKETMVCAGHLITSHEWNRSHFIRPIDSEHCAIWQCLECGKKEEIANILLTASGGPFRGMTVEQLKKVTASDALCHPNWAMGKKITIDSATMVNKALEVMEAHWLFDVPVDNIEVVVQPESMIHSAVEYRDGSIVAQIAPPDMRIPIQHALYYPQRLESPLKQRMSLADIGAIHFEKPDNKVLRGLPLGLSAASDGCGMCTVFNAANEFAVAAFLEGKIGFLGIYDIIEECMRTIKAEKEPSLEQIFELKENTRELSLKFISSMKNPSAC